MSGGAGLTSFAVSHRILCSGGPRLYGAHLCKRHTSKKKKTRGRCLSSVSLVSPEASRRPRRTGRDSGGVSHAGERAAVGAAPQLARTPPSTSPEAKGRRALGPAPASSTAPRAPPREAGPRCRSRSEARGGGRGARPADCHAEAERVDAPGRAYAPPQRPPTAPPGSPRHGATPRGCCRRWHGRGAACPPTRRTPGVAQSGAPPPVPRRAPPPTDSQRPGGAARARSLGRGGTPPAWAAPCR